jgi:hypothetical protein
MPQNITISTLRRWKVKTFPHDLAYTPDDTPPKSQSLADLKLLKRFGVVLKRHASKAINIGYTKHAQGFPKVVWAILHLDDKSLDFYYFGYKTVYMSRYTRNLDEVTRPQQFQWDTSELGFLLFFFFMDCGRVSELTSSKGFYENLEKASRRHIDEEKGK